MNMKSLSGSNLSLDSLEVDIKKSCNKSEEKIDTILVPFYEKDVLIKIPKGPAKKTNNKQKNCKKYENDKNETDIPRSYLVNKERKPRKGSYLEIFRKQFIPNRNPKKCNIDSEIRSLSPEYGDTEQESINETNSPVKDFYNTEAYNEMYYEKIMNQEISQYLEKTFEQALQFTENLRSRSPDEINNLKSISETSHRPRPTRRATVEPVQNIQLGGLGPDTENIKPRLERARSLQRYSEKVRMENRLKIYRKTIEEEKERKSRQASARHSNAPKTLQRPNSNNSYLVNRSLAGNSPLAKSLGFAKSELHKEKIHKGKDNTKIKDNVERKHNNQHTHINESKVNNKIESIKNDFNNRRAKSVARPKEINHIEQVSQAQINFLYGHHKVRPSTALRTLEEKHRMYQEKVKAFAIENNNYS